MKILLPVFLCVGLWATDTSQLVQDHTEFAYDLYQKQAEVGKNTVFSPYSIESCLTMPYLGARGETADEMEETLHLSLALEKLPQAVLSLSQQLCPNYLHQVQGIWCDREVFPLSDFTHTIEKFFGAKINRIDFGQPARAIVTINGWISQQTNGMIPSLLTEGDLDAYSRLVFVNALYFQGSWVNQFEVRRTGEASFFLEEDKSVSVPMMHQTGQFLYAENDIVQVLSMPFKENCLHCVIVLPKSAENLFHVEQEMRDSFNEWLDQLKAERVAVSIPKFKLRQRLDLQKVLESMGMEKSFTTQADFSGIDGGQELCLGKVITEAVFSLDEAGVVAAAATAAGMRITSAAPLEPPHTFTADHPFLFFLVDLNTREIVMMGKYASL